MLLLSNTDQKAIRAVTLVFSTVRPELSLLSTIREHPVFLAGALRQHTLVFLVCLEFEHPAQLCCRPWLPTPQ